VNIYKLDLHKLKHADAERAVIRFVEEHWDRGNELEIITGNSDVMKDIVKQVLEEYKLPCQTGRWPNINRGCIITWT
jgi:DNA-nicking Smr family endonuclease